MKPYKALRWPLKGLREVSGLSRPYHALEGLIWSLMRPCAGLPIKPELGPSRRPKLRLFTQSQAHSRAFSKHCQRLPSTPKHCQRMVRSGQVRSGQVQVRSGQVRAGLVCLALAEALAEALSRGPLVCPEGHSSVLEGLRRPLRAL